MVEKEPFNSMQKSDKAHDAETASRQSMFQSEFLTHMFNFLSQVRYRDHVVLVIVNISTMPIVRCLVDPIRKLLQRIPSPTHALHNRQSQCVETSPFLFSLHRFPV